MKSFQSFVPSSMLHYCTPPKDYFTCWAVVGGILRRKGASRRGVFIYIKTKFDKPAAAARGSVATKNVPKREKKNVLKTAS